MNADRYVKYTDTLTSNLRAQDGVIGLILLGSTASEKWRDEWSDHDFWVITRAGSQSRFKESLDWLPNHQAILLDARHGSSYRTVIYRDRHKIEFAVFDRDEAGDGAIESYSVAIDRGEIEELAKSIQRASQRQRLEAMKQGEQLPNLALLIWSEWERVARGEVISSRHYRETSIDVALNILRGFDGIQQTADLLDARRRLEMTHPRLSKRLQDCCNLPSPSFGLELLDLVEEYTRALHPELNWDAVSEVREWLADASRT